MFTYNLYPLPKEIKTLKDMTTMFLHKRACWYFDRRKFFTWEASLDQAHRDLVMEMRSHKFPTDPAEFWDYMKAWLAD